ncbi:hypothetical protein [Sphingomonas sp. IC4-52]|uniref:hypothetical protein n=1 Tax=Sphingomonas sp. IC4-52 TaxID=2887202 RepID=UPI001D103C0B|nr:hypothetical protein [Sphingomonas sp. IC4-52]MCC2981265.1 hypothetical protein [Sphingomonas sp. IC4-52]
MRFGIGLLIERFGPLLVSALVAAAFVHWREALLVEAAIHKIQPSNLYGAIFNWSAIQVGFAFGVYGFILSKSDGFVGEVRGTIAMKRFITYVRRGTLGGFLLTIASIPITAIGPDPAATKFAFYLLTAWFALFVWTFLAFIRIAFGFGRLVSVPDREPFYGA